MNLIGKGKRRAGEYDPCPKAIISKDVSRRKRPKGKRIDRLDTGSSFFNDFIVDAMRYAYFTQ